MCTTRPVVSANDFCLDASRRNRTQTAFVVHRRRRRRRCRRDKVQLAPIVCSRID